MSGRRSTELGRGDRGQESGASGSDAVRNIQSYQPESPAQERLRHEMQKIKELEQRQEDALAQLARGHQDAREKLQKAQNEEHDKLVSQHEHDLALPKYRLVLKQLEQKNLRELRPDPDKDVEEKRQSEIVSMQGQIDSMKGDLDRMQEGQKGAVAALSYKHQSALVEMVSRQREERNDLQQRHDREWKERWPNIQRPSDTTNASAS